MKKIINYLKKNPLIGISLTAFIAYMLYKFRKGASQTIQNYTGMDVTTVFPAGTPRGIRNNNPLNIRIGSSLTKNPWKGQKLTDLKDKSFCEFTSMEYGARAGIVLLRGYIVKGFDTLEKIVTRWAPASDGNNPSSYVALVIKDFAKKGLIINKTWKPVSNTDFSNLAHSMSGVENGWKYQPKLDVFVTASTM